MSIIEYTGPSNPQEIRKYLMRRTKDEIVHEYLRQWRYCGEVEAERDELKAERDDLEYRYHLLASEMVYEGNSVQHWQQKAMAYKECAGAVYDLKQLVGAGTPAEVVKAVQALAAHVEALRGFLRSAPLESGVCCCGDNIDNHPDPMSCGHSPVDSGEYAISQILDETPAASLARIKAQWQADALEDAADSCHEPAQSARGMHDTGVWLRHMAVELRRQAEGGES